MFTTAFLVRIENGQTISRTENFEFYHILQLGVLLSLKEQGILSHMQFKHTEAALLEQRREWIKRRGKCD